MAEKDTQALGAVSLPAGSYDSETLATGLAAAAKAKEEDRGELVAKAIADASTTDAAPRDLQVLPDHVVVLVDNGLGGQEAVQVYSPKLADQHEEGQQPVLPSDRSASEEAGEIEKSNRKAIDAAVKAGPDAPPPVPAPPPPAPPPAQPASGTAGADSETK